MRYLIKYTKEDKLKYLSHLDLMKTIQRVIRRTGINVSFSQGFNPHIILSIAQPLSVGMSSIGEYMDLGMEEPIDEVKLLEALNECSVGGMQFLDACAVVTEKKAPQAMALIDAARYTIRLKSEDAKKSAESLKELMKKKEFITLKKSKRGEKEADIKLSIKDIKFWGKDDYLVINTLISCGSRENLSARLVSEYVSENVTGIVPGAFKYIERTEMYADKGGELVELSKFFK